MTAVRAPLLDTSAPPGQRIGPLRPLASERTGRAMARVSRAALVRRLIRARSARLAVLVAPPGYGKSTLISEWAEHDERPFLELVAADARSELPDIATVAMTRPVVVVVERADRLGPALLQRTVETAIAQLPLGSTLVLASRSELPLALGRMRADRMLVEVRTEDLRMDAVQIAALLHAQGLDPSVEELEQLVAATEGWPAALLLSTLDDGGAAGSGGSIAWPLLRAYVADEVLASLPVDLRRFAVRTSLLDELSAGACDALLDEVGAGRALSRLTRLTPLLAPVDTAGHRYRWHPIMREVLRGELHRTHPEAEPELHARAARWHQDRGEVGPALEHAAAAGAAELVQRLLSRHALEYLSDGRHRMLGDWLQTLGNGALEDHAGLQLCAALAALGAGDAVAARRHAELGLLADGERVAPVLASLRLTRAVAGAGALREILLTAPGAIAAVGADTPYGAICAVAQGIAQHLAGATERAASVLDEAIGSIAETAPIPAALALSQRAMIAMGERDWAAAATLADRASGVIDRADLAHEPLMAFAYAAAAASRVHEGRADEAKADLRHGLSLLVALGEFRPWYGAQTRILFAHASLGLANVAQARTLLAEASRLARRVPDATAFGAWFDVAWAYLDTIAENQLAGPSSLTIAELRVLRFLPSHRSFREIGAQLNVSGNTVKTQAHAIYRKLGVTSRSEAVARAVDAGLLGQ